METTYTSSAAEFLEFLRPSQSRWWDTKSGRRSHVFRGHADTSWTLLPRGWRPIGEHNPLTALYHAFEPFFELKRYDIADHDMRVLMWRLALVEAAYQFAALGRQIGLESPWDIPGSLLSTETMNYAVPVVPLDLLSLAQHHGIPTQILDWSEDPLTAAYFALGGHDADTDLCVFALSAKQTIYPGASPLTLSWVSNMHNVNIRAQSGIFLGREQGYSNQFYFDEAGAWVPFDEEEQLRNNLHKVVLPASERSSLRELLLRENRSAAHLMPSWHAAAGTVMSRWG